MTPSCKTCKFKVEVEIASHVFVAITEPRCMKFVTSSFDKVSVEKVTPMQCDNAMNDFCGLSFWQPTLIYRLSSLLNRRD